MNPAMTAPSGGLPAEPGSGVIAAGLSAIGAFIGGVAVWVANRTLGKAAFQNAMNDGFTRITASLSAQLEEARAANKELRGELDHLKVKHAREESQRKGEMANMYSTIEALQRQLKMRGINVPQPRRSEDDPEEPMIILSEQNDNQD
jgi:hypothetical protein